MSRMNRREFLGRGAAAAALLSAPSLIPSSARGADGNVAPSERIGVGVIGRGRMGRGHVNRMLRYPEVVVLAVCDVDPVRRDEGKAIVEKRYAEDRASGAYRGCAAYNDYRELLARPDIDAVLIATPDHWHTPMAMDAAKAGKDIYCEKPPTMTIAEGRRLVETVRRYDRVFQTGTQRHSNPVSHKVCDFIRGGGLGKIKSVFTPVTNLGSYLSGPRFAPYRNGPLQLEKLAGSLTAMDIPMPAETVPEGLDWDLWVGPAPWRPYNHCYHNNDPATSTVPWNFCIDFGHGGLSNNVVHSFDIVQAALGMEETGPVEVFPPNGSDYPMLTYKCANGTLLHVPLQTGQDVSLKPYEPYPGKNRLHGMFGALFVGELGWIEAFAGSPLACQPKEIADKIGLGAPEISEGDHTHNENWLECIRTRRRCLCDVEMGHRAASVAHLGDIAWWTGRSLRWDPAKEEFIGDDEANRLRFRTTRAPWRI